jgi:hypothetical protein
MGTLSSTQYLWVNSAINVVLMLLLIPAMIMSALYHYIESPEERNSDHVPAMGNIMLIFAVIIWLLLIVKIIISGIFQLIGQSSWNISDASIRVNQILMVASLLLGLAVLCFGIIAPAAQLCCNRKNKEDGKECEKNRYCGTSIVLYICMFMIVVPIFMAAVNQLLRGGSNQVSKDDLIIASKLASIASSAREGDSKITELLENLDLASQFTVVDTFATTAKDSRAIVLTENATNDAYLIFAGTQSLTNWSSDLQFDSAPYPTSYLDDPIKSELADARGHRGFFEAYDDIQTDVINPGASTDVNTAYLNAPHIHIIGHSLGGAMTMLATTHMLSVIGEYNKTKSDVTCITFGAPAVADGIFADVFDENATGPVSRVVVPWDPVPAILDSQLIQTRGYLGAVPYNPFTSIGIMAHSIGTYQNAVRTGNFWAFLGVYLLYAAIFTAAIVALVYLGGWAFDVVKALAKSKWQERKERKKAAKYKESPKEQRQQQNGNNGDLVITDV